MLKRYLTVLLIISICAALGGCFCHENNNNDDPYWVIEHPTSYYYNGLSKKVTSGDKYMTIKSLETSLSYDTNDSSAESNGYFLILGVDTNLSKNEISDKSNSVQFTIYEQTATLGGAFDFITYDEACGKIVYKIRKETFEYSEWENLKISYSDESYAHVFVSFSVFKDYPIIDGVQYVGNAFMLNLELE